MPIDCTLCGTEPVLAHFQVTFPPATTVSTAGFADPLRSLLKKLFPAVIVTDRGAGPPPLPAPPPPPPPPPSGGPPPGAVAIDPPQPMSSAVIRPRRTRGLVPLISKLLTRCLSHCGLPQPRRQCCGWQVPPPFPVGGVLLLPVWGAISVAARCCTQYRDTYRVETSGVGVVPSTVHCARRSVAPVLLAGLC